MNRHPKVILHPTMTLRTERYPKLVLAGELVATFALTYGPMLLAAGDLASRS